MRILCFIDNLSSGGAQRQIVNLALLLNERGHDVKFLTYGKGTFFKYALDEKNIKVDQIDSKGVLDRIYKVRKYIRAGNQDLVISFLETPNFLSCLSTIGGRKWGLITNERSSKEESFLSKKGRLFKWFERFSDVIVCNSHHAQNVWSLYYPKYRSKLQTIYNTLTLEGTNSKYKPFINNKLNIIIAARYEPHKNMDGIIEAVSKLSDDRKEKICINWYGRIEATEHNSKAYEKALEKINHYNLGNIINLHDATKNIVEKMSNADIVCLCSYYEGLPNVVCEGLFLGKPIIMSRVSDYGLLVDETNGFLCDADNIESIKFALEKAINLSSDEIIEMGRKSKEKAEKLFNNELIADKWISLIKSLEER